MMTKAPIALIALASTASLAQQVPGEAPGSGNIPAPDLFDDQIVCSSRLPPTTPTPTVVPPGAMESALDAAIGMGNVRITNATVLNDLGYVIPSAGRNCGQGIGQIPFTVAGQGSIATDVAEGYSALLPEFMTVYGNPGEVTSTGTAGAVQRAATALERAEADATSSTALLESLRRTLTDAQAKHTAAQAEFNAIAQGPIYQAAAAEWMAKAAVTQSVADYNAAVLEANSAQVTLDSMNYDHYVPLGNSELLGTAVVIVDGMGTVNLAQLRNYTNADLNNPQVATVADNGVTTTTDSNFDAAGNLVVPMRLVDGELQSTTLRTRVSAARTNRDNHRIALAALKEFERDNQNILLKPLLEEAVRRAQAETDYYEQEFQNTLADTTNQNPLTVDIAGTPENEAAPYSIASRHADYLSADNVRLTAETALRDAASAREGATQNVIDQFHNPESFLAQLVARREALKAVADQAVADAINPSMELTDAATAAADAFAEAEAAQTAYADMVGDSEGPIDDLVATLLETDGDDGQALVDAVSQTYGATTQNREAIDALTADTDDGAEQDGPITANTKSIAHNAENIDRLMEDPSTNPEMVSINAGNIATNAKNIATNATNIVTNAGFISHNAA